MRIMKVTETCSTCLKGLAEKTLALSRGDDSAFKETMDLLGRLLEKEGTPPAIANSLLAFIRARTGEEDPYLAHKRGEYEKALDAVNRLESLFEPSLLGAIKYSALGNSMDFFMDDGFDPGRFPFFAPVDKISEEIYTKEREVLILGDNIGDFLFDMKLVRFLEGLGKKVFYAVREYPVQNDLSLKEVASFNLRRLHDNIISTGAGEVGLRQAHIRGIIKDLWEGGGTVIAKGMGNYETISEYNGLRPVIHIMKVKCRPVGDALRQDLGSYIAITGGETDGN
jgi:damage-control phosphatase, subfamily I